MLLPISIQLPLLRTCQPYDQLMNQEEVLLWSIGQFITENKILLIQRQKKLLEENIELTR